MIYKRMLLLISLLMVLAQPMPGNAFSLFGYEFNFNRINAYFSLVRNRLFGQSDKPDARRVARLKLQLKSVGSNMTPIGAVATSGSIGVPSSLPFEEGVVNVPVDTVKDFSSLSSSDTGIRYLRTVLEQYPEAAKLLTYPAIENFVTLALNWPSQTILLDIMRQYPEAAKEFAKPATEKFSELASDSYGRDVLLKIMELYPEVIKTFFQKAIDNNMGYGQSAVLFKIMDVYPEAAKEFVKPAVEKFSELASYAEGRKLLLKIMNVYPEAAKEFAQPALDNLLALMQSSGGEDIINSIRILYPAAQLIFVKKELQKLKLFYPFTNELFENLTQTKQHLIANFMRKYKELRSGGQINYQDYPKLQKMTKSVIDLEWQEQQKGRYTFVHAYRWGYHFYQEIYTALWEIVNGKINNPYRFLRYVYPIKPSWEAFVAYIEEQDKVRTEVLQGKRSDREDNGRWRRHMLFMNYALFANFDLGENTAYYIKVNGSVHSLEIDPIVLIKELKLDEYLDKTELKTILTGLKQLQEEHAQLSEHGAGLLLSFTPEAIEKTVYPAKPLGFKEMVQIKTDNRLISTVDPKTILDTLRAAPYKITDSDKIVFVAVLSHDYLLIPNNGLDIYEFNTADQTKLAAWRAKKDKLMQWIKERVDAKRQQQAAQSEQAKIPARL